MARDVAAAPTTSPSRVVMMSARSKPQPPPPAPAPAPSIYSYLHSQSGLNFAPVVQQQTTSSGEGSPPPAPPVRDASSLKSIKYGPGHEKFPSWPSDTPRPAAPGGGSHRSKSWTDHTNYPKEKGITYTRPYMKRPNPAFTQQLKTVMEKCEKIPPETFESRPDGEQGSRMYLPRVDREGKALGDNDYMVPSPPERDVMSSKPQLTQADLEEYARSYQDPPQLTQVELEEYARSYQEPKPQSAHLTQADLEEYARTYEESLRPQHQQQQSYAQSEGYHSYVSSTDSITTTPFLDRLRRDSEATARPVTITQSSSWDESSATERPGRDSVVTTSSGSASSSETLKWHGSLSDVSVASSSCLAPSSSRQLIAHSARVPTPQRHHSESVLYLGNSNWVQRNNHHNQLRLFPVNTYTVQPSEQPQPQPQQQPSSHRMTPMSPPPPTLSVAERISELERQQTRYTYLDPEKRHRVSDPTLKAIQKKALLSFYERHHSANNTRNQTWRSEPQLAQPTTVAPQSPPPQPPPRPRGNQSGRRASSASDYAGGNWREAAANRENGNIEPGSIQDSPRHQHSSSCGSLSADLLGPLIIGPSISVDDWVPERPPKKPHLRAAFPPPVPDRLPSPDLPPPSPPPVLEDEVFVSDEPLPPPPPELHSPDWNETEASQKQQHSPRSSSAHPQSSKQQERSPEESETQNDSSRPQRSFVGASLQEHCESSNSLQVPIALNATRHISNNNSSMNSSNNNNNNNHSQRPHDANTQEKHNNVNQNGISSQRSMDRAFSLSRSIEDCSSQKSSQRQQNSVTQRYREGTTALKPISNGTSKAESSYQQYRSSTARHFENGQKQTDCSSLPRSNGSASSLLQKYQDSNNRISQLNYVPAYKNMNETFSRTSSIRQPDTSMTRLSGSRSSLRYPTTQKLMVNGKLFSEQAPHLERGTQRTSSILLPPKTHFQRFTEASTEDKSSSQQSLAQQDPPPTFPRLSIHNPQSTSKASYLHRDRGLPNFEGSYKRTMSPSGQEQEPPAAVPTTVAAECDNRVPSATSQPNNEQQAVSSVVVLTSVMTDNKENVRTSNSEENIKNESESGDTVIRCKTTWSSSPVSPPDTTKETETQTQCNRQSPPPPSPPARSPPASPSPPLVTESLQLVQRSEVVLRVNAATSDAASQTESERELEQEQQTPPSPTVPPPLPVRQKLQEEIDCERLSLDLASHLSPSDKLQGILVPAPEHKKLTDYVSGLFRLDTAPRPRTTSATSLRTSSTITSTTAANQTTTTTLVTTVNHVPASSTDSSSQVEEARESNDTAPLSANSAYFTTSESKAKFLTQYGRDMTQSEQLNGICDNKELQKKKEELMARLTRKLQVLRGEHLVVTEESRVNDELGENVAAQVNRLARPHEASKYRLHVEEVGKITSLLLGLSGRLARAENALMGLPNHHAERKILESKRDKLREQLEEAKKLKENIDRRSVCVSNILYKYFNAEEYADYDHFINMKAKLIMDSREIADKIKLGEEQLAALKETLTAPD